MQKTDKKEARLLLLEEFLRRSEKEQTEFTKKEVAESTGYPIATIRTYFGKYLINYLVHAGTGKKFISKGIKKLSSKEFRAQMSQKSYRISEVEVPSQVEQLRQRSFDAFCLAVENYNRMTLKNRVEVFCILMANAWELLLKSHLIHQDGFKSINYPNSNNTLSLRDTAEKIFKENDPVRQNIELIATLRDQSIHLLISELQPELSRIFQASVINFRECYQLYTGNSPFPDETIGLMSLVIESKDLDQPLIVKQYGDYTASQVREFLEKFKSTEDTFASNKLAIPVEYKLALTKKESQSDIRLSVNTTDPNNQNAIIIEKAVPIEKTHPHRTKQAVVRINSKIAKTSPKVNMNTFQALCYKHNIKGDPRFHNHEKLSNTHSYSEATIEKFVKLLDTNPDGFQKAKEHYQNYRKPKT